MRLLMEKDRQDHTMLHNMLHEEPIESSALCLALPSPLPEPEEIAFMSDDREREQILKAMIAACLDPPPSEEKDEPPAPLRVEDRLIAAGERTKKKKVELRCAHEDKQSLSLTKGPTINYRSTMLKRTGKVEDSLNARQREYQARRETAQGAKTRTQFKSCSLNVTSMAKTMAPREDIGAHLYSQRKPPPPPPPGLPPPGVSRSCLLYTSDAADEEDSVDLGGRRILKKKKKYESKDR
eukprot:TRINITY_DN18491_c0_g1_i1.p1 TRINITY_DN18491_c0_g1~~TRINITY_DN18491_c0_g1_i1.p1  ORF type:complete len:238 (-),score=36.80 TRINITY_DN18491_c0_g1_i1:68-781(-)